MSRARSATITVKANGTSDSRFVNNHGEYDGAAQGGISLGLRNRNANKAANAVHRPNRPTASPKSASGTANPIIAP